MRVSIFHCICDSLFSAVINRNKIWIHEKNRGFHFQVKELFDNALRDRTRRWDLKTRLGVSDVPKAGFPSLEEVDIQTIHEAYQFLSKKFIDEVVLNTLTNKKANFLTIEDIKANNVRRNSCKAKIQFTENSAENSKSLSRSGSLKPQRVNLMRRGSTSIGSKTGSRRGSVNNDDSKLSVPKVTKMISYVPKLTNNSR